MRRIVTTYLAIAASALTVATPVGAGKARHQQSAKCDVVLGQVIAADSQALLYRATNFFEFSIVYGCAYGYHHSYRLGYFPSEKTCSSGGCISIHHETLSGPLVAYEFSTIGLEGATFLIVVRDLRNGHVLHKVPTGTPVPPNPHVTGNGFASGIALKSDGAVAWINENEIDETVEYQVHARDKTGNRLLATGTDIDPHSLALAGSTLYWTQGGKPFFTRLD